MPKYGVHKIIRTSKRLRKSLEIVELDNEYICKPLTMKYYPLVVVRAEGDRVWDIDGNEYIDFISGGAVYNIGHRHPKVLSTIKEQIDRLWNYTIGYFYETEPVLLAKKLIEITPGTFRKKVAFGFSGSDAVDMSLIMARAYTKRKYIISFKGSYHGGTYASLSVTGILNRKSLKYIYPMKYVNFIDYPDPYRNPWNVDGYSNPDELANIVLSIIEKKIKKLNGDVAAIIFEPIQGDGGIIIPPQNFIKGLRELTNKHDIVLIADEVQTGMGRTGKWWAVEHYNIAPDLLISGKALGGGMPISAVIGKASIIDSPPIIGFLNSGHAVCASAALSTIRVIEEEKLIERAATLGEYVLKRLEEMREKYNIIGDVRARGLLIGIDIVSNRKAKKPDRATALKICWRAWEKGLITMNVGKYGNVIRIAPPLNISKEDLDKGLEILESSIKDVLLGYVNDNVVKYIRGW
jgi:4-aminobutyrate aminotransferase